MENVPGFETGPGVIKLKLDIDSDSFKIFFYEAMVSWWKGKQNIYIYISVF